MMENFIAYVWIISFCSLCKSTNLANSFDGGSFNFTSGRQSNDGFQCSRDDMYAIMCKCRWDTVTDESRDCGLIILNMQCAKGTNSVMFTLIGIESMTIGLLLLYIYKKPKIDLKDRNSTKIQIGTQNNNSL